MGTRAYVGCFDAIVAGAIRGTLHGIVQPAVCGTDAVEEVQAAGIHPLFCQLMLIASQKPTDDLSCKSCHH